MEQEIKKKIPKFNKLLIEQNEYSYLIRRFFGETLNVLIFEILFLFVSTGILVVFPFFDEYIDFLQAITLHIYTIIFMSSRMQSPLGYYFVGVRFSNINGDIINFQKAFFISLVSFVFYAGTNVMIYFIFLPPTSDNENRNYIIGFLMLCRILVYALPYFFTKRKQFLLDWILGIVALTDRRVGTIDEKIELLEDVK